jgi:hypothetical protein
MLIKRFIFIKPITSVILSKYLFIARFESNTIWLLILFSIISFLVQAQNKNIIISDSLSITAEKYNIKRGKLKKFKFGEYYIVKARPPWGTTTSHTTYKTYEENISRQKYSFTLVDKESRNFAVVKALNTEISKYRQTGGFLFQAVTGIESTNYEGLNNSLNLSATISINSNNAESWNLHLEETPIEDGEKTIMGTLSNGKRTIDIVQVYFDKDGTYYFDDTLLYPPNRFEFIQNGQSLGAVRIEYNFNTQFWFKPNLESTIKLVLAASMTTIGESNLGLRVQPIRR